MTHHYNRHTSTIVPLTPPPTEPVYINGRVRRSTNVSSSSSASSGTTLIEAWNFDFSPSLPALAIEPAQIDILAKFSNTPPLSPTHGISDAYFGMAYSQRYQKVLVRRAGRVQVDSEKPTLIDRAANKMADLFQIKRSFLHKQLADVNKAEFGDDSLKRYSQPRNRHAEQTHSNTADILEPTLTVGASTFVSMPVAVLKRQQREYHSERSKCANGLASRHRSSLITSRLLSVKGNLERPQCRPQLVSIERVGDMYTIKPQ
ncbi:hypothetical protein GGI05_003839 [Coemansia sp. RSA 2603]|nr:hypothetical protein GGI05_003839 [Coemansia sp. RSA 2603]